MYTRHQVSSHWICSLLHTISVAILLCTAGLCAVNRRFCYFTSIHIDNNNSSAATETSNCDLFRCKRLFVINWRNMLRCAFNVVLSLVQRFDILLFCIKQNAPINYEISHVWNFDEYKILHWRSIDSGPVNVFIALIDFRLKVNDAEPFDSFLYHWFFLIFLLFLYSNAIFIEKWMHTSMHCESMQKQDKSISNSSENKWLKNCYSCILFCV